MSLKNRKRMYRGAILLFAVLSIMIGALGSSGCDCEPEAPPSRPAPELKLEPANWLFGTKEMVSDFEYYKIFTITNNGKLNAEDLEIKSIKLATAGSAQFKLIDDNCPSRASKDCVDFPSLPRKIKRGESIQFTMEYKHSTKVEVQSAELHIFSNTKNNKGEDTIRTKIRISAQGGEPRIDVGGPIAGEGDKAKEFTMRMEKTSPGKPKTDVFTLTNVGDGTLSITLKWKKENTSFKVTDGEGKAILGKKFTLTPNDNREVKITFDPKICGDQIAFLIIDSNAVSKKPDKKNGYSISSRSLTVKLESSSPARAVAKPSIMIFKNAKPGSPETQKFKISFDEQQALCDLEIKGITIGKEEGQPDPPKGFSIGKIFKAGAEVKLPTKLSYLSKDELEVEVIYAPKDAEGSSSGTVIIDSNDPVFDPDKKGVITLSAGGSFNLPPRAYFDFFCAEKNSNACKDAGQISGAMQLAGEKKVKVMMNTMVDNGSRRSYDKDGKITKYDWKLVKPPGSSTVINDSDPTKATMIVDGPGKYVVTLTVTDDGGKSGKKKSRSTTQTLNVTN